MHSTQLGMILLQHQSAIQLSNFLLIKLIQHSFIQHQKPPWLWLVMNFSAYDEAAKTWLMNQIWTFGIKTVINHCAIIPSPWNFLDTCIIWAKSKYFIQWGSHRMVKCRSRISKNGFLPCVCLVEALRPLDTHRLQSLTFQPTFNGNSFRSFFAKEKQSLE